MWQPHFGVTRDDKYNKQETRQRGRIINIYTVYVTIRFCQSIVYVGTCVQSFVLAKLGE